MSATKTKLRKGGRGAKTTAANHTIDGDVLTLSEAAAYLRVSENTVLEMFHEQGLPGRKVGADWRFLRSALDDWLRTPVRKSSKEELLAMAGAWKDDPFLDEILCEIYRQRGRAMSEARE
jgi:excisionase family DNA binding protein